METIRLNWVAPDRIEAYEFSAALLGQVLNEPVLVKNSVAVVQYVVLDPEDKEMLERGIVGAGHDFEYDNNPDGTEPENTPVPNDSAVPDTNTHQDTFRITDMEFDEQPALRSRYVKLEDLPSDEDLRQSNPLTDLLAIELLVTKYAPMIAPGITMEAIDELPKSIEILLALELKLKQATVKKRWKLHKLISQARALVVDDKMAISTAEQMSKLAVEQQHELVDQLCDDKKRITSADVKAIKAAKSNAVLAGWDASLFELPPENDLIARRQKVRQDLFKLFLEEDDVHDVGRCTLLADVAIEYLKSAGVL